MLRFKKNYDRSISGSLWKQLLWLVFFIVIVFSFWFIVDYLFEKNLNLGDFPRINDGNEYSKGALNKEVGSRFWGIVSHLLDPGNIHMADPRLRLLVLFIAFSGSVLLSGLLISTFSNSLERRVDKIKNGRVNYRFRKHYVIIGYNDMIPLLIKTLPNRNMGERKPDILIHTSQDAREVRRELKSKLPNSVEKQITVLFGGRDSQEEMERLAIHNALEVFIVGEGETILCDSLNLHCLASICRVLEKKDGDNKVLARIPCHILFQSQSTYSSFQFRNIPDEMLKRIDFLPYNSQEMWAQQVLVSNKANTIATDFRDHNNKQIDYPPLDYKRIFADSELSVHLILVGFTRMGSSILAEACRVAHFANGKPTRITIIDRVADQELNYFKAKYPLFDKIEDIEIDCINAGIEEEKTRDNIVSWVQQKDVLTTIAICFNNPNKSLSASITLPIEVYESDVPILVRQEVEFSTISLLSKPIEGFDKFSNVLPFGMIDNCFKFNELRDLQAKVVNHFYAHSYQIMPKLTETRLEDEWRDLSLLHKWSNLQNVDTIRFKLRGIVEDPDEFLRRSDKEVEEFIELHIETLARMEHARWNADKLLAGFRPPNSQELSSSSQLGDTEFTRFKEELEKRMIHLCIVPYDELRDCYKEIDRSIVRSIPYVAKYRQRNQNL